MISLGSHQNIGLHTGARANVVLRTYLLFTCSKKFSFAVDPISDSEAHKIQAIGPDLEKDKVIETSKCSIFFLFIIIIINYFALLWCC